MSQHSSLQLHKRAIERQLTLIADHINEHDVVRIIGMSVASVRRWRLLRVGPKFIKISAAVRYRSEDLSAWLESRPTGGGHEAALQ